MMDYSNTTLHGEDLLSEKAKIAAIKHKIQHCNKNMDKVIATDFHKKQESFIKDMVHTDLSIVTLSEAQVKFLERIYNKVIGEA